MTTPNQVARRLVFPRPVKGALLAAYIDDGQGSPSTDLAVDGTTPVPYRYTVPASKVAWIFGVEFQITDAGIVEDGFGAIATLTNGLTVKTLDSATPTPNVVHDLLAGKTLQNHIDLARLCGAGNVTTVIGGTNDTVSATLNLVDFCGGPLELAAGEHFEVVVQDNLTALVSMFVKVHGLLLDAD